MLEALRYIQFGFLASNGYTTVGMGWTLLVVVVAVLVEELELVVVVGDSLVVVVKEGEGDGANELKGWTIYSLKSYTFTSITATKSSWNLQF